MVLWIIGAVVLLLLVWYVAITLSLKASFARSEPTLSLDLAVSPRRLSLTVTPGRGVNNLVVESISVNRQAAHELKLGAPGGFVEERAEVTGAQALTPEERADRQREVDELNRQFIYFRGKLKIAGGTPAILSFAGEGSSTVPVEISVTYSRRIGVVGEISFKAASMPRVALDG